MLVTQLFRFQKNDSFGIKGDEPVLSWNKYLFHDQTGSSPLIQKIMPGYLNKLNLSILIG